MVLSADAYSLSLGKGCSNHFKRLFNVIHKNGAFFVTSAKMDKATSAYPYLNCLTNLLLTSQRMMVNLIYFEI